MAQDFLEVISQIEAEKAYDIATWAGEGRNVSRAQSRIDPRTYQRKLYETAKFMHRFYRGMIPRAKFQEAMSTSDFPLLFGDVLDRQALGAYQEWQPVYRNIAKIGTVPDFRTVKRFTMDGAEGVLLAVAQGDTYKASVLTEGRYTYSVAKYGRRLPFTWEAIINDDLDLLKDAPARFARAARRSEEKFAAGLYCTSTGPDSTFFSNTHKNIVNTTNGASTTNPALSITGLQDAFTVLMNALDADSEPIVIEMVVLEVPPALMVTAQNILNATQIIVGADSASQRLVTSNWMKSRMKLVVNPYLPIIDTTRGATAWYLWADPGVGRPAMEIGFLRGYEQPQLFMKSPNAVRVGGGNIDQMGGSFEDDTIDYKIRHVFGGTMLDYRMAVASNGSGA